MLNHFTRWCTWANMIIRVDKCSTFGIKKSSSSSTQYPPPPKLIVNQQLVPPIETGKSFKYLGRYFNYAMDNQNHMSEVLDLLNDLMQKIDSLSCHPKISFLYITDLSSLSSHDILLLLILAKPGLFKILIMLFQNM